MHEYHSIDTRSTVLGRVKNPEDSDSWQAFFRIYMPLIRNEALKAGLSGTEADDVAQETMIELSRRIQTFEYDRGKGTFKAWLYRLTHWRIANHLQKKRRGMLAIEWLTPDTDDATAGIPQALLSVGPDESWEREWRQALLDAALINLRRRLPAKQFQVLDCLMVKQWSVPDTANLLRISRAHLYVLKCRITFALKHEIRRLERAQL